MAKGWMFFALLLGINTNALRLKTFEKPLNSTMDISARSDAPEWVLRMLRRGQLYTMVLLDVKFTPSRDIKDFAIGDTLDVRVPKSFGPGQPVHMNYKLLGQWGKVEAKASAWLPDPRFERNTIYVSFDVAVTKLQKYAISQDTELVDANWDGRTHWKGQKLQLSEYPNSKINKLWYDETVKGGKYGMLQGIRQLVKKYPGHRWVFTGCSHGAVMAQMAGLAFRMSFGIADTYVVTWNGYRWTNDAGAKMAEYYLGDHQVHFVSKGLIPGPDGGTIRAVDSVPAYPPKTSGHASMKSLFTLDKDTGEILTCQDTSSHECPGDVDSLIFSDEAKRRHENLHFAQTSVLAALKKALADDNMGRATQADCDDLCQGAENCRFTLHPFRRYCYDLRTGGGGSWPADVPVGYPDWALTMLRTSQLKTAMILSTKFGTGKIDEDSSVEIRLSSSVTGGSKVSGEVKLLKKLGGSESITQVWLGSRVLDGKTIYISFPHAQDWTTKYKISQHKDLVETNPEWGDVHFRMHEWTHRKVMKLMNHYGTLEYFKKLVHDYGDYRFVFCGQSRGAALAQAMALRFSILKDEEKWNTEVYVATWGAYRWTDNEGKHYLDAMLGDRVVNFVMKEGDDYDSVPTFPARTMGYASPSGTFTWDMATGVIDKCEDADGCPGSRTSMVSKEAASLLMKLHLAPSVFKGMRKSPAWYGWAVQKDCDMLCQGLRDNVWHKPGYCMCSDK